MRFTFDPARDGVPAINAASEQFAQAQWQVSTGKRLRVASDDPGSAQRAVQDQTEIGTLDAYTRASTSASDRLTALDSVLGDIINNITQAQVSAQGARGTTADQTSRDALAASIVGIRDAVAGDINMKFGGTYLFGGTTVDKQPYSDASGTWTYQGDANPVTVDLDRTRSVTIALDGQSVLKGSDPADLLTTLDALAAAVKAGDNTAITAGMDALGRAFARVANAQSQVGADEASLEAGQQRLTTLRTSAAARLSKEQDANLAEAVTKMNQAQVAYQSALGAVGTASKTSLLDYLR